MYKVGDKVYCTLYKGYATIVKLHELNDRFYIKFDTIEPPDYYKTGDNCIFNICWLRKLSKLEKAMK